MDERRHGGCRRRIVATKSDTINGDKNPNINTNSVIKKLQSREVSSKPHRAFVAATAPHRFQNMRLTHQFDTHDSKHRSSPKPFLPFLMKRTKIVEIVAAKNVVFGLAHSGLCAAFSRGEFPFLPFWVFFFAVEFCFFLLGIFMMVETVGLLILCLYCMHV